MRAPVSALIVLQLLCTLEPALAASASQMNMSEIVIEYVRSHGMLRHLSDGEFHPEQNISRIELLTSIVQDIYPKDLERRCFDDIAPSVPAKYTHLFTDVSRSALFAREVCIGMLVGIVQGQPDGSFRPHANVTLAEAAKVITKAYGIAPFLGLRENPRVPWHEPFWYALAQKEAIPKTVRDRHDTITRGEFAEILFALRAYRPAGGFRFSKTPVQTSFRALPKQPTVLKSKTFQNRQPKTMASTRQGIAIQRHVVERKTYRLGRKEVHAVSLNAFPYYP